MLEETRELQKKQDNESIRTTHLGVPHALLLQA